MAVFSYGALSPLPASAACSGAYLTIYENTGGGGAAYTFCADSNDPDFSDSTPPSPGTGHCGVFGTTWNDCASSAYWHPATGKYVCLHSNSSYGGNALQWAPSSYAGRIDLPTWMNNVASSLDWGSGCLQ